MGRRLRRVGRAAEIALNLDLILLTLMTVGLHPLWKSRAPQPLKILVTGIVVTLVLGYLVLYIVYY